MKKPWQRYLAEFVGTLLWVLLGVGTAVMAKPFVGILGIALVFGATLCILVFLLGPVSGAHLNPGVSLGLYLVRRIEGKHLISYMIAQFAGAYAGAYILYVIAAGKIGFVMGTFACTGMGANSPEGYSLLSCVLAEVVITSLLVIMVLIITQANFSVKVAPFVIGATLVVIHFFGIPVTNASANLARSFGTAMIYGGWAMKQLWLFGVSQLIAVVLSVSVYRLLYGAGQT